MSGPRRLAVFLSAIWLLGWHFLWSQMWLEVLGVADYWGLQLHGLPHSERDRYFIFGVAPVAVTWGLWWVWNGFRKSN